MVTSHRAKPPPKPVLVIDNLCVDVAESPPRRRVLDGVSLTVAAGEILGIVGESGAGKSTLGLSVLGYIGSGLVHSAGQVSFLGTNIFDMPAAAQRKLRGSRISYVAQSAAAAFNPAQRLREQVIETACISAEMSRADALGRMKKLLRQFQLPENIGERYPHQVSGGQLQRVMTAMAMLCNPDLVVFDEPTTALDVMTQIEVVAQIRAVIREGRSGAVYVSHDLALVAQMADRIAVMRNGRIVEMETTQLLLSFPKSEYTRSLWAVRNLHRKERDDGATLLSIASIDAAYRSGPPVLQDVSLDLPRGTTVAVVGESGSGKSTLARVVAGLLRPNRGSLTFDGHPLAATVAERKLEILRRIQFVRQSPDTALNPRQTVSEFLSRPLALYFRAPAAERRYRIADLLEMVELDPNVARLTPAELSGGQKQRVALAGALAAKPDLLICDEVTSALDQLVQESILKLIARIQEASGTTCLMITHDMATVMAIADHVVVMRSGRVVDRGRRSQVFSPPIEPYTEMLVSATPQMEAGWLDRVLERRLESPAVEQIA